jgi:hypothetical protein
MPKTTTVAIAGSWGRYSPSAWQPHLRNNGGRSNRQGTVQSTSNICGAEALSSCVGKQIHPPHYNNNATYFYGLGVAKKLALAEKVHARQMTQAEAIFRWLKR